jgi:xanthine dehydrogenase small subunit
LIKFILNNKEVSTDLPSGMLVLDYVRYHKHLTGTKIGCREGDCGACTILVGELKEDELLYRSYTSCLTPLGNVHGKHVVTIEGLNMQSLNPVQQAMYDCSATQCGFCTPGFVVSLAGYCLSKKQPTEQNAIAAIDGNICRCTGYKSIERAALQVSKLLAARGTEEPATFVADNGILPAYFTGIKDQLKLLNMKLNGELNPQHSLASFVGGGTDLYVQKHDEMKYTDIYFMLARPELKTVTREGNKVIIGPSATVTDLKESEVFQHLFPNFNKYIKLVSSTPIRNMATLAGNFINASPIGDFTIFFLALDAHIILSDGQNNRELPLRKLYQGYKKLDKQRGESIRQISFNIPVGNPLFNFEKVSKRMYLDIASVNSAIMLTVENDLITGAGISAGGVAPVPMYLKKTSNFLIGKEVSEEIVAETIELAQSEISPISDARGTAEYKRLLLSQFIKAHFLTLFSSLEVDKILIA